MCRRRVGRRFDRLRRQVGGNLLGRSLRYAWQRPVADQTVQFAVEGSVIERSGPPSTVVVPPVPHAAVVLTAGQTDAVAAVDAWD